MQLTQDGAAFYERCKQLLHEVDDLGAMFQGDGVGLQGRLRVDMPVGVATKSILPRLPEFLAAHPRLTFEISSTDRKVDPVEEGFDCVIRVGSVGDPSLIARHIGEFALMNCVSAGYARARGIPRSVEELRSHDLVHYVNVLGVKSAGFECVDPAGEPVFIPMRGPVTVNNSEAYVAACLAGLGIIQAPAAPPRPLVDSGALVGVLPDARPRPMPISIVYASRRQQSRRVRAFIEWVARTVAPP